MKKLESIKQIINHEFPAFEIESIKKIGEGENSKAFILNNELIFRFPKSEEIKKSFKIEIAVLLKIKSFLNLDIPESDFISKETGFIGHRLISGESLTPEIYNTLEKETQLKIQKALAKFLSQLHKIDLHLLLDCGLPVMNYYEEYSDNFERAKELIFPGIPARNRKIISDLFKSYLTNKQNFKHIPRLIHNDFSSDHILFENSVKKLTGIIDFGDAAIGDPDYDFMYLLDNYGVDFIKQIARFYENKNYEKFYHKLNFFSLANKIQILIGSVENEDEGAVKEDYKNLERWIGNYEKIKEAT